MARGIPNEILKANPSLPDSAPHVEIQRSTGIAIAYQEPPAARRSAPTDEGLGNYEEGHHARDRCRRPERRSRTRAPLPQKAKPERGGTVMAGRSTDWNELHVGYIHDVYMALIRRELQPKANWIGEFLPRSATIILAEPDRYGDQERALAWDEESGWRFGIFVQGDERSPTVLRFQEYIGDDVLPDPAQVADLAKMLTERRQPASWWPWSRPHESWGYPPMYRSYRDLDDGLDERLRSLLPP